jgi:hypothetical protein
MERCREIRVNACWRRSRVRLLTWAPLAEYVAELVAAKKRWAALLFNSIEVLRYGSRKTV